MLPRLGEAGGAQEGAIGGAEVLDHPGAAVITDPGVATAGVVVVQDQGAFGGAADEGAGTAQREAGAGQSTVGDDEFGGVLGSGAGTFGVLVALGPGVLGSVPAGGSSAHNTMQPYLVVNFVIALQGVFPSRQ